MLETLSHSLGFLLDGSHFSTILLTCLLTTAAFWVWTRWIEWGLGFAMVAAFVLQIVIG